MNFGKNLLEKYGWKEGQGIGKNADGIIKPVKASLKFDTAGLGHDRAKEFTDHWWERVFNDAAQNIDVDSSSKKISVKDTEAVEISTNSFSTKKMKKRSKNGEGYNNTFLKSRSTLQNDTPDEDSDEDLDVKPCFNKVLTDEELLKACGGRTAHKGARHGLRLSGKLSRIEAQEQQMLAANSLNIETAQDTFNNWYTVKKSKKNKRRNKEKMECQDEIDSTATVQVSSDKLGTLIDQNDYVLKNKSKKKKKSHRRLEEDLSNSMKTLHTESPDKHFAMDDMLHGVLDYSKKIQKEKNRQKKNELKKKSKKRKNAE